MLNTLRQKNISITMLKHFLLVALIFPTYESQMNSPYSPDFILANLFVVLFLALTILEKKIAWKQKSYLGWAMILFLLGFNVFAFYANKVQLGWYNGQINVSIAFLFFIALLYIEDSDSCKSEDMIHFLLKAVIITNAIGLIPYFMGNTRIIPSDFSYTSVPLVGKDKHYSWLYAHKSEYSFLLVLFLSFTVTYRHLFSKKWTFWVSIAVFALGLIIADTRATMGAALFIAAGFLADYLQKRSKGFSWKYLLWFLPIFAVGCVMLYIFSKQRDLLSLGYRTYIWKAAIEQIRENPYGIGSLCGLRSFYVEGMPFDAWNCHNVFLNFLYQFSILAGLCCCMMIFAIIIASLLKNPTFLTLGIWIALLIPLNMDWCLLLSQIPITLLLLYFIFFSPHRKGSEEKL